MDRPTVPSTRVPVTGALVNDILTMSGVVLEGLIPSDSVLDLEVE